MRSLVFITVCSKICINSSRLFGRAGCQAVLVSPYFLAPEAAPFLGLAVVSICMIFFLLKTGLLEVGRLVFGALASICWSPCWTKARCGFLRTNCSICGQMSCVLHT